MSIEDHPAVKRYRERPGQPHGKPPAVLDADWLRKQALEAGADDVGFVEVTRPALGDQIDDIRAAFPRAVTLVSLVCRTNPVNIRSPFRGVSNNDFLTSSKDVDAASRGLARALSRKGVQCLTPPASFPMDADRWPRKMWPISHKPVAEQAGLGRRGHHRNVIHPRFGNFVALGTIAIDCAVDRCGKPLDFDPCLKCRLCVSVCPVGAISADGHFSFSNCSAHNYRHRLNVFIDWVERVADSRDRFDYRRKVSDAETIAMWQGLTYSISNTCSNCVAVCPAGEDVIGEYLADRKAWSRFMVEALKKRGGLIFVVPGSDAEAHALKHYPAERVKCVGNGRRPETIVGYFAALPLLFQRGKAAGLDLSCHFDISGNSPFDGTVQIRDGKVKLMKGRLAPAELQISAESSAWLSVVTGEESLDKAIQNSTIRFGSGDAGMLRRLLACFPT
jgi:ferredoxin